MIDLLRQRRSVRVYAHLPVEQEKIDILQEAVLRSPSSRNINPWQFIFVQDAELVTQLSKAKQHGSAFLSGAPLAVVIAGDTTQSDVWIEDCSIAAILLQLTAQSLGLGSCWVQIRLRQHNESVTSQAFVQELLGIPEHLQVEAIIGIGYPAEDKPGIPYEKLLFENIHKNQFSQE